MPYYLFTCLALLVFVTGCTPSPALRSVMDIGQQLTSKDSSPQASPTFDPRFRYLRVQTGPRVVFFALGYLDPHPDGMVEVWFSGGKEVLRLRNGRVMGLSGTQTEWLNVGYQPVPGWSTGLSDVTYVRVRDVTPGYRYGIEEHLRLEPVKPPAKSNLLGIPGEDLFWFKESSTDKDALEPTLYALRNAEGKLGVVYSETCLDKNLCFSWQRWPAN